MELVEQLNTLPAGGARRQAHNAILQAVGQIPEDHRAGVLAALAEGEHLLQEGET
jgi:hypothetical protein